MMSLFGIDNASRFHVATTKIERALYRYTERTENLCWELVGGNFVISVDYFK